MPPTFDWRLGGFFLLGLLSLLLLMGSALLWWQARARHSPRLDPGRPVAVARVDVRQARHWLSASPRLDHWLARWPGIRTYEHWLRQTGWPLSCAEALLGSLGLGLLVWLLAGLLRLPLGASVLAGLGAALLVQALLQGQRLRRLRQLEAQLPDALSLMARSMQAGHAFSSALQIAAQESPQPMARELRGVFSEIQYGESPPEALSHWAERVAGGDVRIFVVAVRIQSETGGNLAELLHQTAALIRARQKLHGTVRVLSAEGRLSAWILTTLPFALAGLLSAVNPGFMAQLWTDPIGQRLMAGVGLLMAVGMLWMWRLVRLNF
jgi:tight adherence protein B